MPRHDAIDIRIAWADDGETRRKQAPWEEEAMRALAMVATLVAGAALASEYQDAWGPPAGAPMPTIEARDQQGATQRLGDLAGARGTLLFVVRSADW